MAKILATWICIDDFENASWFPSTKGNSSDQNIQTIYWKCLATCMYSARMFNPEIKLAVFSNINHLPLIEGVDFNMLFKELDIHFYVTPFEYQTPEGYYGKWKNQFYEFSILKYLLSISDFNADDLFCLIDSDCIITGDLNEMYNEIKKYDLIGYELDYNETQTINGNSRSEMKSIFEILLNRKIDKVPSYYAGEFFAAKLSFIAQLMDEFYVTWDKLLQLHDEKEPHLHEEAHVLSYLYYITKHENDYANKFVKRIWTTTYRNVIVGNEKLLIWHLPAEKIYGFKKMYAFIFLRGKRVISAEVFLKKAQIFFTVPYLPVKLKLFYMIKRIGKKLLNKR
jgi:hypothetical protein